MVVMFSVPLQVSVPDWLALAVVVTSILLAMLTLSLMVLRIRPSSDDETAGAESTVRDPILLLSILGVIALAIAAWMLR